MPIRAPEGMTTIACPICAGPVELADATPSCLVGHEFDPKELQGELTREASRALWSAVRALEDSASGARWRSNLPNPPNHLQQTIDRALREAQVLRDLLAVHEGGESDTEHRPTGW